MKPGIHAMLYALFGPDERLDRAAMRIQTETCLAAGAHGICVLGLATEVAKLTSGERREAMEWVAEDVDRRAPLGITIYGNSVADQIEQVRSAERVGANWVILQPPVAGTYASREYIRFFGRVADATSLPVAIQNAPAYFGGRGLTGPEFRDLITQHPNVRLMKGEGSVVEIEQILSLTERRVPIFNGRGGLELTDNLRAGCAGLLLASETIDRTVRIFERFRSGDEAGAEALYAETLPTIVFVMQSLESLICYGKRIFAARTGLTVHDRAPALAPTDFGLALVKQHAGRLGPLPAR